MIFSTKSKLLLSYIKSFFIKQSIKSLLSQKLGSKKSFLKVNKGFFLGINCISINNLLSKGLISVSWHISNKKYNISPSEDK